MDCKSCVYCGDTKQCVNQLHWNTTGCGSWAQRTTPTTLRVRIAVAVTADGDWCAAGSTRRAYRVCQPGIPVEDWELASEAHGIFEADARVTWVEADVYLPAAVETVEGVIFEHGEDEDE